MSGGPRELGERWGADGLELSLRWSPIDWTLGETVLALSVVLLLGALAAASDGHLAAPGVSNGGSGRKG